jgi:Acyltransferase
VGTCARFLLLLGLKAIARIFYSPDATSIGGGPIPGAPWNQIRLICFLNHTSLYEPIFAAAVPNRLMWEMASRAVVPIADVTLDRTILGRFLRALVPHAVPITREPDGTWDALMNTIDEHALVIILPEGRMRRASGLDRHNKPMTARGGVVQIMEKMGHGQMLMAYSGGLHHVQIPGQKLPHIFKTIRIRFELLEIADYLAEMRALAPGRLKSAIKTDLDRRRDRYSPMTPESTRLGIPVGAVCRNDPALDARGRRQ